MILVRGGRVLGLRLCASLVQIVPHRHEFSSHEGLGHLRLDRVLLARVKALRYVIDFVEVEARLSHCGVKA